MSCGAAVVVDLGGGGGGRGCGYCCPEVGTGGGGGGKTSPGLSTLVVGNGATKLTCSSPDVFADWSTLGGGVSGSCSAVAGLSTLLVAILNCNGREHGVKLRLLRT